MLTAIKVYYNINSWFQWSDFLEKMAEQQLEHEQMMRDVQRAYVDFLDDSDEQGIYDRLVR